MRASGLQQVVLRPSWFMQNFTGQHAASVAAGEVVSATGAGRVGIIDAADIAAVAVRALLEETPPAGDLVLAGLDHMISRGEQDFTTTTVEDVTGRPPRGRDEYLAAT